MEEVWLEPAYAKQYADKSISPELNWYEEFITFPAMLELLPKRSNKIFKLLDYGCGSGEYTKKLNDLFPGVVGTDISAAMIKIANARYPEIEKFVWDFHNKFPLDTTFNVIFSKLVVHFVDDLDLFAKTCNSLLKRDGTVIFATTHPFYSRRESGKYFESTHYSFDLDEAKGAATFMHRSFESYIEPFLRQGFALTGIKEPDTPKEITKKLGVKRVKMNSPKRLILRFTKIS